MRICPLLRLDRLLAAAAALLFVAASPAATVVVTNDVTTNTTWFATNTYLLQTVVYVRTNVALTIEAGTVVKGATSNLIARTGILYPVAALWVTRGGRLFAVGTRQNPIIFTFDGDDVNDPNDVAFGTSGQWGGLVLCGNGVINSAGDIAGSMADPKYDSVQGTFGDAGGLPGVVPGAHLFGGGNDYDSSGILRYVSIRYPGQMYAPSLKLNGLTFAAVGRGTIIDYVEVYGSSDDAFEWWGGCVNTRHLVAAFCEDDDFDTAQGYRGINQFWFGIKPPWRGSTGSLAFETDGQVQFLGVPGLLPKSRWAVHNATLIGRGKAVTAFGGGVGWRSRDEAAPNVFNSIFAEFAVGVWIDNNGLGEFINGEADMRHTIVDCALGSSAANPNAQILFTNTARMNTVEAALLRGISYTNNSGLDPRPQPDSPALHGVVPQQDFGLVTACYRGAFGPRDWWANGWTSLSRGGFLAGGSEELPVSPEPPVLLAERLTNGLFRVSFDTVDGLMWWVIEASMDLRDWIPVTGPLTCHGEYIIELTLMPPWRFYRARPL